VPAIARLGGVETWRCSSLLRRGWTIDLTRRDNLFATRITANCGVAGAQNRVSESVWMTQYRQVARTVDGHGMQCRWTARVMRCLARVEAVWGDSAHNESRGGVQFGVSRDVR
jgi:hypothetical protein